ncbi:hypothetical protein FF1_002466 [Malus domestica]
MVKMGGSETPRLLAFDHYNLGSLGRSNGKALRQAMESPRPLRRHPSFVYGHRSRQGASPSRLMLLVFGHQHHGSPPWSYRPHHS